MSRGVKAGGGGGVLAIIIAVIFMFMSGGDDDGGGSGGITGLIGGGSSGGGGGVVSGETTNTSTIDTSVASGSRNKRTVIKGNGNDIVTLMVYICGTDLESEAGMASNDIVEMTKAKLSDKVNIIICTGGAKKWQIQGISNSVHQFYKVDSSSGQLVRLEDNRGSKPMTDPATLTDFIKYCAQNYPANRNELILWDHGGGSVTGFGYDEKNGNGDSMTLAGINTALKNAGVTFDFIGFDACLMATAETALVLDNYADYLIASEETEPGIGWYYTNWLTKLSSNTSWLRPRSERISSTISLLRVTASAMARRPRCPSQTWQSSPTPFLRSFRHSPVASATCWVRKSMRKYPTPVRKRASLPPVRRSTRSIS